MCVIHTIFILCILILEIIFIYLLNINCEESDDYEDDYNDMKGHREGDSMDNDCKNLTLIFFFYFTFIIIILVVYIIALIKQIRKMRK